jgi:hypothetical protein
MKTSHKEDPNLGLVPFGLAWLVSSIIIHTFYRISRIHVQSAALDLQDQCYPEAEPEEIKRNCTNNSQQNNGKLSPYERIIQFDQVNITPEKSSWCNIQNHLT